MAELADLTAVELGAVLRTKEASPVEAVEAALVRIEARDGTLGAFVDSTPSARWPLRAPSTPTIGACSPASRRRSRPTRPQRAW